MVSERQISALESRLVELLKQEDDPQQAMEEAAARLWREGSAQVNPHGMSLQSFVANVFASWEVQAELANTMLLDNPERFETAEELITFLLPTSETFD